MSCLLCGHDKTHKHGKTSKGSQRYFCPVCKPTFTDTFDTIYYRRQLQADEVHTILQSHSEIQHYIGKDRTQRLERTNGILRQQTGRWHRQQNKLGKQWEQTKVTARLVVSYFNWIWEHSRLGNTAAFRSGLASGSWAWDDFATFPTLT
jgi:transposase-like protein